MSGTETEQQRAAATATAEVSDFANAARPRVQAQDRPRARGGGERRADARAAGAGAHDADFRRRAAQRSRRSSPRSTRKLTEQINLIIHHEDFQQLESAWRGLHHLVNNTETDEMLKIQVFNISKKELGRTLKKFRGTAWDQSPIFKKVYEEEYGQFGGEPYGVLVGDYYFDHGPQDVQLLGDMAQIAAAAHAPFIAAAAPTVMQMESWHGTGQPARPDQDLPDAGIRRLALAARERGLRATSACACRAFWRACRTARRPSRSRSSHFEEDTAGAESDKYSLVQRRLRDGAPTSPARSSCTAGATSIRGVESGGAVEGLPAHTFPTDDGGVAMKCPTEIAISDRREAELAKNGFMPLIHKKNSDFAAFIGAQSLQKPQEYDDPGGDRECQPRRRGCPTCSPAAGSRTT